VLKSPQAARFWIAMGLWPHDHDLVDFIGRRLRRPQVEFLHD
jgi:hypothetical protein